MNLNRAKKQAFWIVSKVGLKLYSWIPLFGRLKGSFAVIREGSQFLVVERNDGRGMCFPGGLGLPWETEEETLRREVLEETGLTVTRCTFLLRYDSSVEIPVRLAVFEVEIRGQIRSSWEGTPCWMDVHELESRVISSQQRIVEVLSNI